MAKPTTSGQARREGSALFSMDVFPIFLALFATLMIGAYVARQGMEDQRVQKAFSEAAEHASPHVQDAIAQVAACEQHAIEHPGDPHDWQRVLWFPCVQQGEDRLRSLNAESQIPDLHQHLIPVQAVLAWQFSS